MNKVLLNLIEGKLFPFTKGITTYPDRDENQERLHQCVLEFEKIGKVQRCYEGDGYIVWQPTGSDAMVMNDYEKVYPALECEHCKTVSKEVVCYRQRTMYSEREANYSTLCQTCKEYNDTYWDEQWAEYYRNCM